MANAYVALSSELVRGHVALHLNRFGGVFLQFDAVAIGIVEPNVSAPAFFQFRFRRADVTLAAYLLQGFANVANRDAQVVVSGFFEVECIFAVVLSAIEKFKEMPFAYFQIDNPRIAVFFVQFKYLLPTKTFSKNAMLLSMSNGFKAMWAMSLIMFSYIKGTSIKSPILFSLKYESSFNFLGAFEFLSQPKVESYKNICAVLRKTPAKNSQAKSRSDDGAPLRIFPHGTTLSM